MFLNVSLCSSKAINLLNTVPKGAKILLLGIKGVYNIFSECTFLKDMNYAVKFHLRDKMAILVSAILDSPSWICHLEFFKFICFIK